MTTLSAMKLSNEDIPSKTHALSDDEIAAAIEGACRKIAPVWPLKHFVAVNPFLGFTGQSFAATCASLKRVAQVDMLMTRAFYRKALEDGEIQDEDLSWALARAPAAWAPPHNIDALKRAAAQAPAQGGSGAAVVATIAELLDRLAEGDRQASRTAFMIDEISKWCAAYFDDGQANWRSPWRGQPLYQAWRSAMRFDRNPEVMGVKGFRKAVADMPQEPRQAIAEIVRQLGIPARALEDYLVRALLDIGGWAAYARYLVWNSELYGQSNDVLADLLAVRVVWGYALFLEQTDPNFIAAWADAMRAAACLPEDERLNRNSALTTDLILQEAYEHAYQQQLMATLAFNKAIPAAEAAKSRKLLQAAFCIDVRSEVYRRAIETVLPEAETIGFAGFFGFPIEYVRIGQSSGDPQCPVLLKPAVTVREAVGGATESEAAEILVFRVWRRRIAKAWKAFKVSAVSCFTYVESAGLLYAPKLVGDSAGLTRTVPDPNLDGLAPAYRHRIGPTIAPQHLGGHKTGFEPNERIAMAAAVLKAMSLSRGFARLVMLTGHGSTSVNNPHASGLDCGACGGHTGEANARVAAAILNDPDVRIGLRDEGIDIPEDTWFLGCLHDTTTDTVAIFDEEAVPERLAEDLKHLKNVLALASGLARTERAYRLGVKIDKSLETVIEHRSRDWSQIRPEWGLAGNAAFIAAPRERTRSFDLGGRAFLHSYDWRQDQDFAVLEQIMTAPMVVASWINLQYYGSTVNNRAFGSGNKVLHNVVGTVGVLEGNGGDLKTGLPWQSLHDGRNLVHKPLRLNVIIEAPENAINAVIEKHGAVRELVDNSWVHLFSLDDEGRIAGRYLGGQRWERLL